MKLFELLNGIHNGKLKEKLIKSKKGKEFENRILEELIDSGEYVTLDNEWFKSMKDFRDIKKTLENYNNEGYLQINSEELKKKIYFKKSNMTTFWNTKFTRFTFSKLWKNSTYWTKIYWKKSKISSLKFWIT